MYLSIEFQEEYKRLDRLCKDYFRSSEGDQNTYGKWDQRLWKIVDMCMYGKKITSS